MSPLTPDHIVTEARPVPHAPRRKKEKAVRPPPGRDAQARSFTMRRRMRAIRRVILLVMAAVLAIGGTWAWKRGKLEQVIADAQSALPRMSNMPGLVVAQIEVVGAHRATPQAVVEAAAIPAGQKIAEIDLGALRDRIEALGWVKTAQISRVLPDTVLIKIVERVPFGLWQFENKLRLIDRDGVEITGAEITGFEDLPMVVDLGAPAHAADLFRMLEAEPALAARVESAVRVGERRWDLHLAGGIDVLLPEDDPEAAWLRLAALERHQGILERDIVQIDLRLPDRLTVRQTPEAAKERREANSKS